MTIHKLSEKEFIKNICKHLASMIAQMNLDEAICGDTFIEFTDRKIEVLNPQSVIAKLDEKGNLIEWVTKQ